MDDPRALQPTDMVMVAPRLIALRAALGINKADFADAIGIDRSSYTKIEKAQKPLGPDYAYRIFQLYGVDLNFIYLGQIGGLPSSLSARVMAHLNGRQQ